MAASNFSMGLITANYYSHSLVGIVAKPYDTHELGAARKGRESWVAI